MIPEIGNFALILALLLSLPRRRVLPIAGAARGDRAWMAVARPAARGQTLFITLAFGCLLLVRGQRFLGRQRGKQFEFAVAVALSDRGELGIHEGSLLLWVLMLAWWTFAVASFRVTCRTTWSRA